MDKYSRRHGEVVGIPKFTIPKEEYVCRGHSACPGCGTPLAMRYTLKALGPKTILSIPAGCGGVILGLWPGYALKVPVVDNAFECTAAIADGIRTGFDVMGIEDANVVAWAGDGGTVDIGLQALSATVDRNANIIYIMLDNEAYMNTGIQKSGCTPIGAWTTTTPVADGKGWNTSPKKRIMEILVANGISYGATVNVAYPEDFIARIKEAKEIKGTKFIHVLAPCTPGWRIDPRMTIEVARLATQTGIFPLYKVVNGKYTLTKEIRNRKPVRDYLKLQGRFRHLSEESINEIQRIVDAEYERLMKLIKSTNE
ncbi:MAG: thiamine pyrophosphate-dependent enzyme [Methanomassiliicoccales archaeon]